MSQATVEQTLASALQHHQAGRLAEAETLYRQIVETSPAAADAWHLLGVVASQSGRWGEAAAAIQRAVTLRPNHRDYYRNLGLALLNLKQYEGAVAAYYRYTALDPREPDGYRVLGHALRQQGRLDEALAAWRTALGLHSRDAHLYVQIGDILREKGRLEEAVTAYRQAVDQAPGNSEAQFRLGDALFESCLFEAAIASYQKVIALKPNWPEAYNNLGNAQLQGGRLDEAIAAYGRAIGLNPDFVVAHANIANAFRLHEQLDEAMAAYRRVLGFDRTSAEAHRGLGNTQKDAGLLEEAVTSYRAALEAEPENPVAYGNLLYMLPFHPGFSGRAILEESRAWARRFALPLAREIKAPSNDRSPERRLRIGYVSPDFRDSCQALFVLPLLRGHDRREFEIFCYAGVRRPDAVTERFKSHAGVWRDTVGMTDEELARQIRVDQIDILVDLTLHMADSRLLVFARRPAPVQITWLACPGTSGLETMDYRLTDPHLDPPGAHDADYAEKSLYLPETYWAFAPLGATPDVRPPPVARNGFVTFGCCNNFCKVNAGMLRLWARIMNAVENSQLLLVAGAGRHRQSVLDLLQEEGVAPERVTFAGRRPLREYLALYHEVDISLDTLPHNGHTTSLDSYWMGVPVVTLVGETAVGRAGLSQLTNLGMTEFIAHTPEEYVRVASALGGDVARLAALRSTLRERLRNSRLMDTDRFARALEKCYREAWRKWCGGKT